jgi:hypothetical protein
MPKSPKCQHETVDVSETWIDANGQARSVEIPVKEVGTCLVCGKRVKRDETGPWRSNAPRRAKAPR